MKRYSFIFALVLGLGCAATPSPPPDWVSPIARDHPLVGEIYETSTGESLDVNELRARVNEADFILIGETHDNTDHHRLQASVIGWLLDAKRAPVVVFEMLDRKEQERVREGQGMAADDFAEHIGWAESGWPAWEIYRPVFEVTLRGELPMVAANIGRKDAMAIATGGQELAPELVERHGLDEPLPDALQAALQRELVESHCGHFPDSMLAPMVTIQRARDAQMAEAMLDAARTPVVLIAGGGHVRADRGVPWYLARHTQQSVLSIGLTQVKDGAATPDSYGEEGRAPPFDYVWFTPRANDIDHCAELKKRMESRGGGNPS